MSAKSQLAILGTGNIGRALAIGFDAAGQAAASAITLTRRHEDQIADLAARGFTIQKDNRDAVRRADTVIIAVQPKQLVGLLREIAPDLDPARHLVISVVTGVAIADIVRDLGKAVPVVRAMPNTATALGQSMTCLATNSSDGGHLARAEALFGAVGKTLIIDEELMIAATALGACGIAFFLRAIRAASQGGIEIGFHPEEALTMAAQTALGAASLVLERGLHPESEIDSVTTPRGCTISGLNEMEHRGFSSALIRGIVTSDEKARSLK